MQEVEVESLSYQEVVGPTPGAKPRESLTELDNRAVFRVADLGYLL